MLYKQFYTEVGKLLYALAGAEGTISEDDPEIIERVEYGELADSE